MPDRNLPPPDIALEDLIRKHIAGTLTEAEARLLDAHLANGTLTSDDLSEWSLIARAVRDKAARSASILPPLRQMPVGHPNGNLSDDTLPMLLPMTYQRRTRSQTVSRFWLPAVALFIAVIGAAVMLMSQIATDNNLTAASSTPVQAAPEAIVLRFIEQFNSGTIDSSLYADGFLMHQPPSENAEPIGRAATIAWISGLRGAFPDLRVEVERVLTDNNFVTVQYRIIVPLASGTITAIPGIDIYRIEGDELVEMWMTYDTQSLALSLAADP